MADTHFVADTHFHHANIIKYCNRPYSSPEEMNEALVKEWNSVVGHSDIVWHLGDVTWGPFDLNRLNGVKHLIIGNHDNLSQIGQYFGNIYHYHELRGLLPKNRVIPLMHYPIESWNHKFHGGIHFHGHTHGTLDNSGLMRFDVGADCWDMKPVSLDSILALIPERKEQAERDESFKKLNQVADEDVKNGDSTKP